MKVAPWASRHARSILFLLIALVTGGVVGTLALPVSLFPHISFPRIRVNLDAGERPAERMTVEVTRPVEESLRSIPGVRGIQSTTSRGSAEVSLTFDWGEDMATAFLQAEAQINRIMPSLPSGTTFEVRRMDPTVFPVIAYSLTSDKRPLTELHDLAQYQLRPVLSAVTGVAKISVDGGATEEFRVVVDPARLRAHGLAFSDITTALSAANVLTAVGRVEDNFKLYLVVTDTRFKSIADIGKTVVRSGAGGITLLSDVATIRSAESPQYVHSTADGHDAVLVNVFQQPGGNTVEIAGSIRRVLADEQKRLPPDVKVTSWYDQSDLITQSATSVRDAVVIGVALAALVLLLFLRNLRMTLIAALAVPVVLAITALLLYVLNQSFNIMTLGGMAAAVGLIIDDAIVMSEHIVRRLHGGSTATGPGDAKNRILAATDEFTKPLAGSSLSTIIIHIPPAFLVGVFGAFFAALSLSMATSLVISFFVAWLVIPVIAGRWLRAKDVHVEENGPIARGSYRVYESLMRWILPHSWLVLLLVIPLLIAGYLSFQHVESGVMPVIDEGGFVIDYVGPPGASITEMDRLLGHVESILQHTPEVQAYSRRTGFSLGGDISESNNGDFFVRLKGLPRRSIEQVMDDVRNQVQHEVPGLDLDPAQLMEDLLGDLTGKPQPIVVNVYSDDEKLLADLAPKVADAIGKIPDVSSVVNGVVPAGDAIDVEVDRIKTSLEGVDPDSLTKSIADLLSGTVTTQIQQGAKLVDVRVWTPKNIRHSIADLGELTLRAPDGHVFPLKRVATFNILPGQPEITRDNLKRVVSITARSGRDLGSTIRDVKLVLDQPGLIPQGVTYTLGGQYEQQQIAFHGVLKVIVAAGALVFLLLLFLYERLRVAIAIMLTTVLAIAAVFIGLMLTHTELNISSLMGMVMIVGNVTEVAIFYYSEYADFMTDGNEDQRLIAAGTHRMRAIAMTTVAAILALLPLALDLGKGSAMLQPLAIAIITGLIVQLPLVLIVLPSLLRLFGSKHSHLSA
jgi:multidrug efflux pump subunit AcrB